MERVRFNRTTPTSDSDIPANVVSALGRGFVEADSDELPTLHVVANGPSAAGARVGEWALALNGAINLFPEGSPPPFWAALDSQPLVAEFLNRPDPRTTFFVASRCHPSVFDRLQGFDVRLWHLADEAPGRRGVPPAVSVTAGSLMLMRRLGWRRFEIWGWDCCLDDKGNHHAHGSELGSDPVLEVDVEGARFLTKASWLDETEVAANVLTALQWSGAEFTIHGDGLTARVFEIAKAGRGAEIHILGEVRAAA